MAFLGVSHLYSNEPLSDTSYSPRLHDTSPNLLVKATFAPVISCFISFDAISAFLNVLYEWPSHYWYYVASPFPGPLSKISIAGDIEPKIRLNALDCMSPQCIFFEAMLWCWGCDFFTAAVTHFDLIETPQVRLLPHRFRDCAYQRKRSDFVGWICDCPALSGTNPCSWRTFKHIATKLTRSNFLVLNEARSFYSSCGMTRSTMPSTWICPLITTSESTPGCAQYFILIFRATSLYTWPGEEMDQ